MVALQVVTEFFVNAFLTTDNTDHSDDDKKRTLHLLPIRAVRVIRGQMLSVRSTLGGKGSLRLDRLRRLGESSCGGDRQGAGRRVGRDRRPVCGIAGRRAER